MKKNFVKIPENWKNKILNKKWTELCIISNKKQILQLKKKELVKK